MLSDTPELQVGSVMISKLRCGLGLMKGGLPAPGEDYGRRQCVPALVLLVAALAASPARARSVTATVVVESDPGSTAVNPVTNTKYVANAGADRFLSRNDAVEKGHRLGSDWD